MTRLYHRKHDWSQRMEFRAGTTYILLLGVALYHGLNRLRVMVFELTLKPAAEKAITPVLLLAGLGLFGLSVRAAVAAHVVAMPGARG